MLIVLSTRCNRAAFASYNDATRPAAVQLQQSLSCGIDASKTKFEDVGFAAAPSARGFGLCF